jgi:hypothetical protein
VASFYIEPVSASGASRWKAPQSKAGQKQTVKELYMNVRTVRTITRFILAVALMASAAVVYAAEQSGQGGRYPYTGPDTPVMTSG